MEWQRRKEMGRTKQKAEEGWAEPGSIMLATQASMAAEPVPETGTVKSFLV